MSEIIGAKCDVCGKIALGAEGARSMVSSNSGYFFFQQGAGPYLTYNLATKHWCPRCLVADITRWVESFAPPPRRCDYGGCKQPATHESTLLRTTDVPIYSCQLHRSVWAGRSWVELP